ncbi:MAG: rhomboid family intramembrane serine protease [Phaeodactylibacter sp.]|nr:rhomboid family intramembrane serine protease [Phaeodactylibacter sp.]MCB9272952.1 rhomboid family intramembrane serine protease [Lewinellaceae bacterium]
MFQSIWDDVKREFGYGNMVTRIIIINVAVFVVIHLVNFGIFLYYGGSPEKSYPVFQHFLHLFCMSSDWRFLLTHPWGLFTSMFLHEGFWHILWNMLFLYWFGRIVGDFIGNQRVLPIYLLGGLAGAVLFFISANLLNYGGGSVFALGASAGVMAIVVAAGAISPDYLMRLILLGDVKLKYIVGVLVLLDVIGIGNNINTGGHFAHLGGAFFGWLFIYQLRNGADWALPANNILDGIARFFRRLFTGELQRQGPKVAYRNPSRERVQRERESRRGKAASDNSPYHSHQEQLDAILDKIKESGYESLSEEEKEFLFNASKK